MTLSIRVHGKVQGIFFREGAKTEAEKLGIKGFVKNDPDGTVYIEVEGEEGALKEFLGWCERGPQGAEVEKVESDAIASQNFADFQIRF
jgi:acylphosphatase